MIDENVSPGARCFVKEDTIVFVLVLYKYTPTKVSLIGVNVHRQFVEVEYVLAITVADELVEALSTCMVRLLFPLFLKTYPDEYHSIVHSPYDGTEDNVSDVPML